MTDDARLQRLTELARKVWGSARLVADDGHARVVHSLRVESGCARWACGAEVTHPRALDALEAALLALAGLDSTLSPLQSAKAQARLAKVREWREKILAEGIAGTSTWDELDAILGDP